MVMVMGGVMRTSWIKDELMLACLLLGVGVDEDEMFYPSCNHRKFCE
jgi:hypothetical protein